MTFRALGLATLLLALCEADSSARAAPRFDDSIEVREITVWFDDSVLPQIESIGRRGDDDFVVLEDGAERERVTTSGDVEREPVDSLLWFDPALASPGALAEAATALADASGALAAAGRIELGFVGVGGVEVVEPQSPIAAASLLAERSRAWRKASGAAPPALDARLRALDRLALEAARPGAAARRILWIAVDSWSLTSGDLAAVTQARNSGATSSLLTALGRAGRLLAAYGWAAVGVAARPLPDAETVERRSRQVLQRDPLHPRRHLFALLRFPWRRVLPAPRQEVALTIATDLGLQPIERVVEPTSGRLVGESSAIADEVRRIATRRRLVVKAQASRPGGLHAIEVRWRGGDDRSLPTPRWRADGTPPDLTLLRLDMISSSELAVSQGRALRIARDGDGSTRLCFSDRTQREWIRLSLLPREASAAPRVGEVLPAYHSESGDCAPLDPSAVTDSRLLLLEDAATGDWGALEAETSQPGDAD